MTYQQSYKAYVAATQTVAKTKQVVMLYDAAIKSVRQAKDAIEAGDIETRYNSISKACEIVFGLQASLDFESAEEMAKILYDFYSSIDSRLFTIHRSNDVTMCEQIISELKMMRDAWMDIDKKYETGSFDGDNNAEESSATDSTSSEGVPPEGGVAISA